MPAAPLAAFISPGRSLDAALQRVQRAEELGYELVLDNHIANRDGLVVLAAYGQVTDRLRLGTGVYPALLQSVVSLGQQAATLDELIGGRLVLGLGTSHRETIEAWHGIDFPDSPLTAMREILTALRSLFRDGRVETSGEYARGTFGFMGMTPRPDLPIYLSALGPKMLELAGELADGVVLWLCDPDYIASAVVPHVTAGAQRAGRDPGDIEIVPAVTCAVTDEPAPALAAFRRTLVPYLALPFYRAMLVASGFDDDLDRYDAGMAEGDLAAASAGASDAMLHRLAGIGDAATVRAKLAEYREAGATLPAVGAITADGTASFEETLAAAAEDA